MLGLDDGVVEDAPAHRARVLRLDLSDQNFSRRRRRRAGSQRRLHGRPFVVGTIGTPLGTPSFAWRRRAVPHHRDLVERPLLEPLRSAVRSDGDDASDGIFSHLDRINRIHGWHVVDVKVGA